MAWDFSTEPEFEEKLEWMRAFVREEIFPLETLDLHLATYDRLTAPLKVYFHINNSNPILCDDSPERRAVEAAGVQVGHDGMEFAL